MEHAATLDLEDFEDSELQDRLERARRQAAGRMTLMGQLFAQAQDVVTIVSFAAGLVVYAPWLIVLLAIALVPAFVGEAHFNAQSYSLNYARTAERRELDYVRQTGASVETAKEVKIFGLNAFLIDRYRALATSFLAANRKLARAARERRQRADGDRHDRLLRRLRVHRLAHAAPRVHDRRPHVSRRLVPPPAHAAREPADGVLAGRGPGALPRRSVLVLRDPAGNRVAARRAAVSVADPRGLRVRGRRLPLSGRRALGGASPRFHAACRRSARAGRRERRRQDDAGEAAGAPLRSGRGPHPARRPRSARVRPLRAARRTSASSSRISSAIT